MKFKRAYEIPKNSILLLGPRGTGKSTFIKNEVKPDFVLDLLKNSNFRPLSLNPSLLEEWVTHLKPGQTILIDEIQKIPALLDEVHHLIEDRQLHFILTGSSARKLKKSSANLLAGRALSKKMYPLTLHEIGKSHSLDQLLNSGCLPRAVTEKDPEILQDFLFSYVETYLKEEIFQEGLTRNLNDFSKFIELAARYHGQILNLESLAREVGKSGDTVKSWFQILKDTLVGYIIDPYPLNLMPKESKHSRFYFFDCGVARAAEGISSISEIPERRGFYFETLILNELKTYFEVKKKSYKIFYYSVSSWGDLDFVIEIKKKTMSTPAQLIGIEVKYSKVWKPEFEKVLNKIQSERKKQWIKSIGIYTGDKRLTRKTIEVLPLNQFVELLWSGKLIS